MIVKWKPTPGCPIYRGTADTKGAVSILLTEACEVEVTEDKAAELLAGLPENFSTVGAKAVGAPDRNKAELKPERNK
jgi:hypothetical protein